MTIRRLVPEDLQRYHSIRLRALKEEPVAFGFSYEDAIQKPLAYFAEHLASDSDRILLGAFEGEDLVGIVGVTRETGSKENHRAFIRSMYVAPEHRGKGFGERLLSEAISTAKATDGLRQITLSVTARNDSAALALYKKFGFQEYGRAPEVFFAQGQYYDEILMILRVTEI